MEVHHADELVLGLVEGAVDVGVVLAEASGAHQTGKGAVGFVAEDLAIFGDADGHLAVGVRAGEKDVVVVRAVHRPEVELFLLQLHRRIHVVLVVGQMARLDVEGAAGDLGGDDLLVAVAVLVFAGEVFQFSAQDGAVGEP